MQAYDLYQDIAQRTQGDVYIGVVGPVRTGKSTFIKRLMETMVIPAIENAHVRARAQDDLPAKRFRKNGHDNETGVCSR